MTDAELRALCERATPGPWYAVHARKNSYGSEPETLCPASWWEEVTETRSHETQFTIGHAPEIPGWDTDGGYSQYCICEHDAAFIAAAREALPALLDRAQAAETRAAESRVCQDCGGLTLPCSEWHGPMHLAQALKDAEAKLSVAREFVEHVDGFAGPPEGTEWSWMKQLARKALAAIEKEPAK